MEKDMLNIKTW